MHDERIVGRIAATALLLYCAFCVAYIACTRGEFLWDFGTYYHAAGVWAAGGNPYDGAEVAAAKGLPVDLYVYPPVTLNLFKPFLALEYPAASFVYLGILCIALAGLLLLWRNCFLGGTLDWRFCLLAVFAFRSPLFLDLRSGNICVVEQVLIWSAFACFLKRKPGLFCVLILAGAVLKMTAVLFLPLLFLMDHPRRGEWFYGACSCIALFLCASAFTTPGLFGSFVGNALFKVGDERGLIQPSSLAFIRDMVGAIRSGLAASAAGTAAVLIWIAVSAAAVAASVRRFRSLQACRSIEGREVTVALACLLYAVVLPRFKGYNYMVLLVPTWWLVARSRSVKSSGLLLLFAVLPSLLSPENPLPGFASLSGVCTVLLKYSSLLLAYGVWFLYLREASALAREGATPPPRNPDGPGPGGQGGGDSAPAPASPPHAAREGEGASGCGAAPEPGGGFLRRGIRMVLVPALFYLVCFTVLTFPLVLKFRTHYIGDEWDAAQNVWNIWWVNTALTKLHQPVFFTTYLHYPHGTSLLGHTLNPFNGFAGIVLQRFMTLTEAYNVMVIFGFVAGGWGAFLLCWLFSRSYAGSLLGGYLFTFSPFHFTHALGHLQLVSLEWVPVFAAACYLLFEKPTVVRALASSLALFLALLCDYYYAFYCVILAVILAFHRMVVLRDPWCMFRRGYRLPLSLFAALVLATTGGIMTLFLRACLRDPFVGGQPATENSLDLLSLFVYGHSWRFGRLTEAVWSRIPPNPTESSLYLGVGVIVIMAVAWSRRKRIGRPGLGLWFLVFAVFTVLAMGPELRVWGTAYPRVCLPYRLFATAIPILTIAGCVMRMMVISYLAVGVIAAMAYGVVFGGELRSRMTRVLFAGLLVLEYLPLPLPAQPARVPAYIRVIKSLPPGGIVDRLNDKFPAHYYQTLYERPRAVGLISRYPSSVEAKYTEFDEVLILDIPRYARKLYDEYKLRYLLVPPDYPPNEHLRLIYADRECRLYALRP